MKIRARQWYSMESPGGTGQTAVMGEESPETGGSAVAVLPGRGTRAHTWWPGIGPTGFAVAFGTAAVIEIFALLALPAPLWVAPLAPLALALAPVRRLRRIGLGAAIGWASVPIGLLTGPVLLVLGIVRGVRRLRGDTRAPEREPLDPWAVGALGMSVAWAFLFVFTWRIIEPTISFVPGSSELSSRDKAIILTGVVLIFVVTVVLVVLMVLLALPLVVFTKLTDSAGPHGRDDLRALVRGSALALLAGALLTPVAWRVVDDTMSGPAARDPRDDRLAAIGLRIPADYRFTGHDNWCTGFQDPVCYDTYRYTASPGSFAVYEQLFQPDSPLAGAFLPLSRTSCAEVRRTSDIDCDPADTVLRGVDGRLRITVRGAAAETTLTVTLSDQRLAN